MATEQIVVGPLLVALLTAIATLLARRYQGVVRGLSVLGGVAYLGAVALLFARVSGGDPVTYQVSGWPAPFGITLVADSLSVFMLALGAVVSMGAVVFSVLYVDEYGQRVSYHPLYHFMMVGVSGAFLTADVFNLFVWFEVMLMSSYVLVVFYSGPRHTAAALRYVVLNLVGSALMLVAIGGLYATTGTLNMADIARRLADPAAYGIDPAPVLGLSAILFTVFALKAGLVPFQFWVPGAYRAAPAPVAAMLAGVVKKVGVYAIVRLYFTVFAVATFPDGLALPGLSGESSLAFYGPVLFVMAAASILLGGVGAVARDDLDDLLSYSSIGQVGFIALALAVAASAATPLDGAFRSVRTLGIAAALVYSLNHALAKSVLFLVSGAVFEATGSIQLDELGGLAERAPWLSATFFTAGLALVGIPPLAGFFGKFMVFDTAVRGGSTVAMAAALAGAILTIAYFSRAWNRGFWGSPSTIVGRGQTHRGQVAVVAVLALALLAVGVGFDAVVDAANAAAEAAVDHEGYVEAADLHGLNETGGGGAHAIDSEAVAGAGDAPAAGGERP